MDPNENLRMQRACVKRLREIRLANIVGSKWEHANEAERLADLVEAMDGWLSGGGFKPHAWDPVDNSDPGPWGR